MTPEQVDRMARGGGRRFRLDNKKPVDPVRSARQKAAAQRAREQEAKFKAEYPDLWAAEQAAKGSRRRREARLESDRRAAAYKEHMAQIEAKLGWNPTIWDTIEDEDEVSTEWGYR
jgi:hypothetical protein